MTQGAGKYSIESLSVWEISEDIFAIIFLVWFLKTKPSSSKSIPAVAEIIISTLPVSFFSGTECRVKPPISAAKATTVMVTDSSIINPLLLFIKINPFRIVYVFFHNVPLFCIYISMIIGRIMGVLFVFLKIKSERLSFILPLMAFHSCILQSRQFLRVS